MPHAVASPKMLRSSFSIKQLIPRIHNQPDDDDISLFWDNDEKANLMVTGGLGSPSPKPSKSTQNRRSTGGRTWLQGKPTKNIPPPIIIRSSQDLHRIHSSTLPPLPDTPDSSRSSLCSCEHHATTGAFSTSRPSNGKRSLGLSPGYFSARSSREHERGAERRMSSPPGSPLENPRPSPQLPLTPPSSGRRKESIPKHLYARKLTFDIMEALDTQPNNDRKTEPRRTSAPTPPTPTSMSTEPAWRRMSTPTTPTARVSDVEERSNIATSPIDALQQLIRETDQVFNKSGGKDITSEGKLSLDQTGALAIHRPPRTLKPPSLKPNNSTLAPVPPPRSPRRPPARTAPIARTASVSKVRRSPSQRSQKSARRRVQTTTKKPAFNWTASARDLLNVRLFARLEVDEVLTPGKLHEIRMSRCSSLVPRISTESVRTEGSETTPVDPFSLQDLPTRIGAAGVAVALQGDGDNLSGPKHTNKPDSTLVASKDVSFPALPAKNPARFPPHGVPLPSIPEVLITTPNNKTTTAVLSPSSTVHPEHEAYVTLPSTNYTLVAPFFRQGPIRLARTDIVRSHTSSQLSFAAEVDRSLDWTAFQISILGGAGDLYSESRDYLKREEEEERLVDDLCDWWEGYGFECYGRIQRDADDLCSSCTTIDATAAPTDHPQKPMNEPLSGFYNRLPQSTGGELLTSRFSTARNVGSRRWTVEGRTIHPATGKHLGMNLEVSRRRRPSMESLPQSPMLDLEVMKDVKGEEYVVPMGYNLDHDLGDFLAWEAQNVWMDGFGVEEEVELRA